MYPSRELLCSGKQTTQHPAHRYARSLATAEEAARVRAKATHPLGVQNLHTL